MNSRRPPTKLPNKAEKEKQAVVVKEDGDEEHEEVAVNPGGEAASGVDTKRRQAAKRGSGRCSVPCCQADKCTADLMEEKRYNCRHKVCEMHSKAAAVVVAGRRQRFCQQCSRFSPNSKTNAPEHCKALIYIITSEMILSHQWHHLHRRTSASPSSSSSSIPQFFN